MVIYFPQEFTIEDVLAEYDLDKDEFISLCEFIGNVRGEGKMIDDSLKKKKSSSVFVIPVASPSTASTLSLCLCVQESLPHSGKSKRL